MAKFDPQEIIDEQIEFIDSAIATIEARMVPYEKLAQKRTQLVNAKRALMGATNRITGGVATRLTIDEIITYLRSNPGKAPAELAQHFGSTQQTVSSHIYRNKQRFINKDGRYYVVDPAKGINTADDIEEEEDDE